MENWIGQIAEPQRLYLAWQAPDHLHDRFRWAVAVLEPVDSRYSLRYLDQGPEFEALNQGRSFAQLLTLGYGGYPAFAIKRGEHLDGVLETLLRRLPPRNRPDFPEYLRQFRFALDSCPSDFALLGATEAKLPGDGFSLVDPLDSATSSCDLMLEVAGFRYYAKDLAAPLEVGQTIEILPEPDNHHDAGAVQISYGSQKIGNINRLQAPTFRRWLSERTISGVIERLNGKPDRPRVFIFVRVRSAQGQIAA